MDFLEPSSSTSRAQYSRRPSFSASNQAPSTTGGYSATGSFQTGSDTFSTTSTPYNAPRAASRPPTRASTRASTIGRPSTSSGQRSRQTPSIGVRDPEDDVVCAISEGRGVTPTVGICFIHISTGEVVLSQISDNQFYVRTIHKLQMHEPSRIIMLATSCPPYPPSTLYSLIDEHVPQTRLVPMDRRSWSEASGLELLQRLASKEDAESIKVAIEGNFYITCSLAAVMSYLETNFNFRVVAHSLRVRYQPSEGTMMIDVSAIQSFELIRNMRDLRSKNCLFGLLNQTLTPMGVRMLRSNIVQPSTLRDACLTPRYDAIEELIAKEEMFTTLRKALHGFTDIEKLLTKLIIIPQKPSLQDSEQAINNVLMLKTFLEKVAVIFKALGPAKGALLLKVRDLCSPDIVNPPLSLILKTVEPNVAYVKTPLELRNQRTFAVKSGTNGLLDVARKTYQEGNEDSVNYVERLKSTFNIDVSLKFDNSRMFFLKLKAADFEDRVIPDVFVNQVKKKGVIECQTIDLKKLNQRVYESAMEAISQSDKVIQELLDSIRLQVRDLFRVCEAVALLDMLSAFTQLATLKAYVRPDLTGTLALKSARHPLLDAVSERFVPNDYYATEQYRFQIVTGPNMSGKSTYIRSAALLQIMAQVGSFVPADYAAFPIIHKVFARTTTDDSIEANLSTFSVEMREMAFILRNVDAESIAVIDELGRGTSTRDGLGIALAMSEALIKSKARVWFATHFVDIAKVLANKPGVLNLHLATHTAPASKSMTMLYKVATGPVQERGYGIALARAMGFPESFLAEAERVSKLLTERKEAARESAGFARLMRRRKLVLNLYETLGQIARSGMGVEAMGALLERLRGEFVEKMSEIYEGAEGEEGEVEEVVDGSSFDGEIDETG